MNVCTIPLGLGVKYVSDQRAISELIDGEMILYDKQLVIAYVHLFVYRTEEDENEINHEKDGHISELCPHEH